MSFFRREAGAVVVAVRLTPRGNRDAVEGIGVLADGRGVAKVRVRAVPEAGAANAALIATLAKALGVPKSSVSIASGDTQRLKQVRVSGDAAALAAMLEGWRST